MLSLLLLLSQQMALTHALSHWAGSLDGNAHAVQSVDDADEDDGSLSRSTAQDQTCHQCLAFAQFASTLGNTPLYFAAADPGFFAAASNVARPGCVHAACGFRSRAPPAAV
ncbi:MAG TPA: hypothetical protein VFG03_16200 [Telluria sp.]|nr:hypothetical protein [Telluria sp.]